MRRSVSWPRSALEICERDVSVFATLARGERLLSKKKNETKKASRRQREREREADADARPRL